MVCFLQAVSSKLVRGSWTGAGREVELENRAIRMVIKSWTVHLACPMIGLAEL